MIRIKCTGDFKHTLNFLERSRKMDLKNILDRYGREGVKALQAATPVSTGQTASKWGYTISMDKKGPSVTWTNDEHNNGIPIVILIQYGHGTKNGGYVSGVDFINPALKKVMDQIADSMWKEVTKT